MYKIKIPNLIEWYSTLKGNLQKDIKDYKLYLYLLNNEFIEAYLQSSKVKYEEYFSKLSNSRKITELPPIFPLEEENLKFFSINSKKERIDGIMGEFANNVLIFKFKTEENIYCFYFLDFIDEKQILKQGYLRFYRDNVEKEMINYLKDKGTKQFFEKYSIKSENELFQTGINYEIILHNLEEDSEKVDIESKIKTDDYKEIMNSIKNNMIELKKTLGKNIRRMSLAVFDDNKIGRIYSEKRRSSFSKGDKDKDDKKENVFQKIQGFFKKEIKVEPGIKGLRNVGATSYMNATLQCFSNSDKLKTELINKYEEYKKDAKTSKKLTFALAEVIYNLWKVLDDKKYIPEDFKRTIGEMNPLFKKIGANDPKDLILFLLIKIHEETNIKIEKNQILNNTTLPNPHDFDSVYKDFNQYYTSNNNSIISNEFYGCVNSLTTCCNCKYSIHNIQSVNILFFPLEEVRKFKNHNIFEGVSIIECFEYYEKYDIYPSFYCNICRFNYPAYSYSKIINCPNTLIINLNRGRGLEFNVKIKFEEYIDLRNFIVNPESPYYYELKGVISHFGSNDEGGHFIAFCKNSDNCYWYKFNDEMVDKCSFEDALTQGMPYVLFYSHVNA